MTDMMEDTAKEPNLVTVSVYNGIDFKIPEKIKIKDKKKLKWKVVFCQGKEKKSSSQSVECTHCNPVFNTVTQLQLNYTNEPVALLVLLRDHQVGQVIISLDNILPKEDHRSMDKNTGELEPVKSVSDPGGCLVYSCCVDSYREVKPGKYRKRSSVSKTFSLSRHSIFGHSSQSVASVAASEGATGKSRKGSTTTVKKLKNKLFKKSKSKQNVNNEVDTQNNFDNIRDFDLENYSSFRSKSMVNLAAPRDEPAVPKFNVVGSIDIEDSPGNPFNDDFNNPFTNDDYSNPFNEATFPPPNWSPTSQRQHNDSTCSAGTLSLPPTISVTKSASMNSNDGRRPAAAGLYRKRSHTDVVTLKKSKSELVLTDGSVYPSVDDDKCPEITDCYPWETGSKGGKEVKISGKNLVLSTAGDLIGAWLAGVRCVDIHLVTAEKIVVKSGKGPDKGCVGPIELETKSYGRIQSDRHFTYAAVPTGIGLSASRNSLNTLARSPSCSALASESPRDAFTFTFHSRANSGTQKMSPNQTTKPPLGQLSVKSKSSWDITSDVVDAPSKSSFTGALFGGKVKKRDSGKGTFSKKQLLAEQDILKSEIDRVNKENTHLRQVVAELRLTMKNKEKAMEVQAETHQEDLLELQNYIDRMQYKIIENGFLELLEKSPPRKYTV